MQPSNDYKLLRVIQDTSQGDPDFAASQSVPADVVVVQRPPAPEVTAPIRIKIELVLEWLDARDLLVTSGRGSFDFQALRIAARRAPLEGDAVVDRAVLQAQMSHRPIIIDDILAGDRFAVRVTNMTPPANGEKARILYREIF